MNTKLAIDYIIVVIMMWLFLQPAARKGQSFWITKAQSSAWVCLSITLLTSYRVLTVRFNKLLLPWDPAGMLFATTNILQHFMQNINVLMLCLTFACSRPAMASASFFDDVVIDTSKLVAIKRHIHPFHITKRKADDAKVCCPALAQKYFPHWLYPSDHKWLRF